MQGEDATGDRSWVFPRDCSTARGSLVKVFRHQPGQFRLVCRMPSVTLQGTTVHKRAFIVRVLALLRKSSSRLTARFK